MRLRRERPAQAALDIAGALFVVWTRTDGSASSTAGRPRFSATRQMWSWASPGSSGSPPPEERERLQTLFCRLMRGDTEPVYARTSVLTADGGERIIQWHNTVLRDGDGAVCGTLSSGEDITEWQYAEAALGRANAKLNLLSAITRHDILNQITVARAYIDFAAEGSGDPGIRDYLDRARIAVGEIQKQIEFSRDYQDMGVNEPAWQRPEDLVRESARTSPSRRGSGPGGSRGS